jgi:chemotaxis protein MotA
MDLATVIGFVLCFGVLGWAIVGGGDPMLFVEPGSMILVLGGTLAAMLLAFPMERVKALINVVLKTVKYPLPDVPGEIDRVVQFANLARREGLLALEEKLEALRDPFMVKGLRLVIDGFPADTVREIMAIEIDSLSARHSQGKDILETLGAFAPAYGMIGTLIGLVQMLNNLKDPSGIGKGMAIALLTTFYGAVMANACFLPLANKLETRAKQEGAIRELMIEGILSIQAGDKPALVKEKLRSFVPPKERVLLEAGK